MKNFKSAACILLAMLFITACTARTPEEAQIIRDQAHEREMARIQTGQSYRPAYYDGHHNSLGDNMAIAAAVGFAYAAFTPSYAPTYRGGSYYDSHNRVITRTVYETRVKTVEAERKKYKKKKAGSFKKWSSRPENSKKLKKTSSKTGSVTAAKSKWAGSTGKNTGWAKSKSKPKQRRMIKKSKPKPRPRVAKKSYSSSKKKYR